MILYVNWKCFFVRNIHCLGVLFFLQKRNNSRFLLVLLEHTNKSIGGDWFVGEPRKEDWFTSFLYCCWYLECKCIDDCLFKHFAWLLGEDWRWCDLQLMVTSFQLEVGLFLLLGDRQGAVLRNLDSSSF